VFLNCEQVRILQVKHEMRSGAPAERAKGHSKFWTIVDVDGVTEPQPFCERREDESQQLEPHSDWAKRSEEACGCGPRSRTQYSCPPSIVSQAPQAPDALPRKFPCVVCPWTDNDAVNVFTQDVRRPTGKRSPNMLRERLAFR
jgi:hypothetical protein